jgi:putative membrane protein
MILPSLLFAFLAAVVLALTGRKYLGAAATQGTMPLLAVVLGLFALAV